MKKITCPVCKCVWKEDETISYKIETNGYMVGSICIDDFVFCPVCFFNDSIKRYRADAKKVLLVKSAVEITHIPVLTELGDYVDIPIKDMIVKNLLPSGFGVEQDDGDIDDHTSTWGGAGPDCISGRLEAATPAALKTHR